MTFDKVLKHFKAGKRIYRQYWRSHHGQDPSYSMKYIGYGQYERSDKYSEPRIYNSLNMTDMLAEDWEVLDITVFAER